MSQVRTDNVGVKKMNVFKRSWQLTKSAWHVLLADKELVALPVISMITGLIVLAITGLAVFAGGLVHINTSGSGGNFQMSSQWAWPFILVAILCMLVLTLIDNFIAAAVIHGVLERLNGGDPTIKSSLAGAKKHLRSIALYSVFTGLIGVMLQYLSDKVPFIAKIFVWLGGTAFNIATFFALPFIVSSDEELTPIDATKKSITTIKKVWGESLVINFGLGIVLLIAAETYFIAAAIPTILIGMRSLAGGIIAGAIGVIGLILLMLFFGVLSAIVKTAVFYWATTGKEPEHFDKEVLRQSFTPKKARKLFI